ncbi:MAG: hypothetical protein RRY38_03800, partial [Oscillospiraceae bacterium]
MSEQRKTATLVLGADSDMGVEIIRGLAGTVIAHCYAAPELLEPLCVGDRELISISGDLSDLDGIGALISQIEQLDFDISKLVHLPSAPARLERFREFDARRFERDFNLSFM